MSVAHVVSLVCSSTRYQFLLVTCAHSTPASKLNRKKWKYKMSSSQAWYSREETGVDFLVGREVVIAPIYGWRFSLKSLPGLVVLEKSASEAAPIILLVPL